MKEYILNTTWGIRCYSVGDVNRIEVVMLTVPWLEIVEEWSGRNKDEANRMFKKLRDKYKVL